MNHREGLCLALSLVTTSLGTVAACSSSSSPNPASGGDAGEDVTGVDVGSPGDSSARDGASDSAAEANGDGGSDAPSIPTPNGTKLAKAGSPSLYGMTSDGYAVYLKPVSGVMVVATSGQDAGTEINVSPPSQADGGNYFDIVVVGSVVFSWPNLDTYPGASGPMYVWSAATGSHLIPGLTLGGFVAASGDGSKIIYGATTSTGATTGDIVVANTDGSNPTVLESQVGAACVPQASFVGANQTDPLVAYCLPTDAATATATLDAFQGASWTKTNLATGLKASNPNPLQPYVFSGPWQGNVYALDSSSSNILTVSSANEAIAIAYPGGTSSNLESAAASPAYFTGSGGAVDAVYVTQAGALHASTLPTGTPATLVSSGVSYVYGATSPDGKWGVYGTNVGTSVAGQTTTDLTLFATSLPATTKSVTMFSTALFEAVGASSFFTGDSTHLLWDDAVSAASNGAGTYTTFHAYDLASGTSTVVGGEVWLHYSIGSGTKVLYNDHSTVTSNATGNGVVADIKVADVAASPLAPTLVQAGADVNFVLTPDQKTVVYAYTQGDADAGVNGIYAVSVP